MDLLQRIGDAYYWLGAMFECANSYEVAATRAAEAGLALAQIKALSTLARPFGFIDPDRGIAAVELAAQLTVSCGDTLLQACTEMLAASN